MFTGQTFSFVSLIGGNKKNSLLLSLFLFQDSLPHHLFAPDNIPNSVFVREALADPSICSPKGLPKTSNLSCVPELIKAGLSPQRRRFTCTPVAAYPSH